MAEDAKAKVTVSLIKRLGGALTIIQLTDTEFKPWYYGCIGGVPIVTIIRHLWMSTMDSIRTNRYRLPAKLYVTLWLALWVSSVGMFIIGIPEGLEAVADYQRSLLRADYIGPVCGPFKIQRFYRIMARQIINSLPLLVTMTIFFFPAVVRP